MFFALKCCVFPNLLEKTGKKSINIIYLQNNILYDICLYNSLSYYIVYQ